MIYMVASAGGETDSNIALLQSLGFGCRLLSGRPAEMEMLHDRQPGCVMIDVEAVGIDLAAVVGALPLRRDGLPVVVLSRGSDHPDPVEIMRLGACDLLTKPLDRSAVRVSLQRLFARLGDAMAVYRRWQHAAAKLEELTEREREILCGLLCGRANKTLAHELGISIRTVEMHRSHLMNRLGVTSLAAAIRLALDAGFDPDEATCGDVYRSLSRCGPASRFGAIPPIR